MFDPILLSSLLMFMNETFETATSSSFDKLRVSLRRVMCQRFTKKSSIDNEHEKKDFKIR